MHNITRAQYPWILSTGSITEHTSMFWSTQIIHTEFLGGSLKQVLEDKVASLQWAQERSIWSYCLYNTECHWPPNVKQSLVPSSSVSRKVLGTNSVSVYLAVQQQLWIVISISGNYQVFCKDTSERIHVLGLVRMPGWQQANMEVSSRTLPLLPRRSGVETLHC